MIYNCPICGKNYKAHPSLKSKFCSHKCFGESIRKPPTELFWSKVSVGDNNQCWEWQAYTNAKGYGVIRIERDTYLAHRISWEMTNGSIPEGLCVCHKCDNPPCVNPSHLFLGTRQDNNYDRFVKGRGRNGPQNGENNNHAKLTWDAVKEIRELVHSGVISQGKVAPLFGITQPTVSRIVGGKGWHQK